ncbi:MAG: preprotein translocase subunit SecE [Candidatus Omnitrophica bacterium]|nr:preprotein translocase subunit SecE [Candidatus Omnitrophota bacterium]
MEFLANNIKNIILAVTAAILIGAAIKYYQKIKTFIIEVKQELGKVAWSTRKELMGSTAVVIVSTLIVAVFIGAVDLALSKILSLLFK